MLKVKMLINLLKCETAINRYICNDCSQNGVAIKLDDAINRDNLIIVSVDRYYNHLVDRPRKSPDCLIIQRCEENNYIIYIVELRNIRSKRGFRVDEIIEKFITCLDDFMSNRFANYFHNTLFHYTNIRLLFITDPYGFKQNTERQEKLIGHKMDALLTTRIPKYFGKHIYINHKLPSPTIKNCSN